MSREGALFELLDPVVSGQGVDLVEVAVGRSSGAEAIRLVIHREAGVSHTDCVRVTRAAIGRIEAAGLGEDPFTLEVSSPGLDRIFKHPREFDIFRGRAVRVWLLGEDDVELAGIAGGRADDEHVVVERHGSPTRIAWSSVRKAKLSDEVSHGGGGK